MQAMKLVVPQSEIGSFFSTQQTLQLQPNVNALNGDVWSIVKPADDNASVKYNLAFTRVRASSLLETQKIICTSQLPNGAVGMIFPLRRSNRRQKIVCTDGTIVRFMEIESLFDQVKNGFRVNFFGGRNTLLGTAKVLPRHEDDVLIAEPSIGDNWVGIGGKITVEKRDVFASRRGTVVPWSLDIVNGIELGIKHLLM